MAGVLDRDPAWSWDTDGFQGKHILFWLVAGGNGTLRAGDDRFELSRGDCLISDLREPHHGRQDPHDLMTISWATFEMTDPATETPVTPANWPPRYRRVENTQFLNVLIQRTVAEFRNDHTWRASLLLRTLLLEVLEPERGPGFLGDHQDMVQRIETLTRRVQREPGKNYPVEQLAETARCSVDHFIRLFKKHKGTTPTDFVIRCRIDEARHLLLFSNHSVARIAEDLGYTDVAFFSRQFKRRVGVSPRGFRKSAQQ